MIAISRALARQLRAAVRKSAPLGSARSHRPLLGFHAGPKGLSVRWQHDEVAVELQLPGPLPPDVLVLPSAALDDFEGRQETVVDLTLKNADTIQACWQDGAAAQVRHYPAINPEKSLPFPEEPERFRSLNATLLKALDDAAQTVAKRNACLALSRLQLRGKAGEIVGTDRRQLLVQRGFLFPWKDDVLVPALGIFGWQELPQNAAVAIGRSDTHVCIRIGPWKFHLAIDKHSRYPRIDQVIPSRSDQGTTLRLALEDAAFLVAELPRLPGSGNEDAPVTVDLTEKAVLRCKEEESGTITELLLNRSTVSGPPVRFVCHRQHLAQAAKLRLGELHVAGPESPLACRDSQRIYVWVPLNSESAIPSTSKAVRIPSNVSTDRISRLPSTPIPPRRNNLMPLPPTNGHASPGAPDSPARGERSVAITDLIAEAEGLRTVLADASTRLTRLLSSLKQHRRDSRAMQAAMQSLKQIKLGI